MAKRKRKNDGTALLYDIFVFVLYVFVKVIVDTFLFIISILGRLFNYIAFVFSGGKIGGNNSSKMHTFKSFDELLVPGCLDEIDDLPLNHNKETFTIRTSYDDLFDFKIRERGAYYYLEDKVFNYSFNNNTCSCNITGSNNYDVLISFYKNKKIKNASCNCPYYLENNKYCKHIYALLIKYYYEEKDINFFDDRDIKVEVSNTVLFNKFFAIINSMNNILDELDNLYSKLDDSLKKDISSKYGDYDPFYRDFVNRKSSSSLNDLSYNFVYDTRKKLLNLIDLYSNICLYVIDYFSNSDEDTSVRDDLSFSNNSSFDEDVSNKLKNKYGLLDEEIEKVKKEGYDPSSFEEEELEDDDYYSEDPF